MILWESDIQESVVFKPVEIRGKRGRKKMKKANGAIYIPNMNEDSFQKICNEKGLQFVYVTVPPHGDLIDRDALRDNNCDAFEINGADGTVLAMDVSIIDAAPIIIPGEDGE